MDSGLSAICKSGVEAVISGCGVTCEDAVIAVMRAVFSFVTSSDSLGHESLMVAATQNLLDNANTIKEASSTDIRDVFEELIAMRLAANAKRKSSGSFYTPDYIVDYIVRASLSPALQAAQLQSAGIEPYLRICVLDAAVGSGRFVHAAAKAIANAIVNHGSTGESSVECALRMVTEKCLYGVDIGRAEVESTILTLCLECGGDGNTLSALRRHVRVGNALLPAGDDAVDWNRDFPEVLNREPSGFDAVVGNPPWLSYSGRESAGKDKELLKLLRQRWPSMRGWPSTHGAFLQLATELCRAGGGVGQIAPEQILDLKRYASARQALLYKTAFTEPPLKVDEKAFEGVTSPSCIVILRKTSKPIWQQVEPIRATRRLSRDGIETSDDIDSVARAIVEKMKRFPTLPREAFGDPGVHTGNCADVLIRKSPEAGCVPLLIGRNVVRYHSSEPSLWLVCDPQPRKGGYYRVCKTSRYEAVKVMIRQTATHPIAARGSSAFFRNSLLACYGAPGFTVEYLLAILNSRLIRFFHQHEYRDGRQQAFPQVKVHHLRSIPIPLSSGPNASAVRQLEELAPSMEECVREGLTAEAHSVDRRIDQLVYTLYGLSKEEQRKVESLS